MKDPDFWWGLITRPKLPGAIHTGLPVARIIQTRPHYIRQVLAQEPDGNVVILAIGPLRNLAYLLKSHPDDASPMDGVTLVAKKVKRLDIMGGTYPPAANKKEAEWNFKQDPAAAAFVCSNWPTPVLFNGEGGSTCSGRRVTYDMPEHNPLAMAYRHYPSAGFAGDRLSWDSISSLVTTRGASPWYRVVSNGFNAVDPTTGVNSWQTDENRQHSYLVLKAPKAEVEQALEDMQTAGWGRPEPNIQHCLLRASRHVRDHQPERSQCQCLRA